MRMEEARRAIVTYGKKLITSGLTHGTGGNISYVDRTTGEVAITPSGYTLDTMTPEMIVITDLQGKVLEGDLKPTSELDMHLGILREREDLQSVMHAHTDYATALACLQEDLPPVSYMLALAGPDVRCAPYRDFGTAELAEVALRGMEDRRAVLLANHGVLTGAESVASAFNILEAVEYVAKLYLIGRAAGKPVALDGEVMARMKDRFRTYGQPKA